MYNVLMESHAERDLRHLDNTVKNRIVKNILYLKNCPRPSGAKKLTGSKSDWRLRTGDYRILYEVDDHNKTIKIFRIKHRKEAYRQR